MEVGTLPDLNREELGSLADALPKQESTLFKEVHILLEAMHSSSTLNLGI